MALVQKLGFGTDRKLMDTLNDIFGKKEGEKNLDRTIERNMSVLSSFKVMLDALFVDDSAAGYWAHVKNLEKEEHSKVDVILFVASGDAESAIAELLEYQNSGSREDQIKNSLIDYYDFSQTVDGQLRVSQRTVSFDMDDEEDED